MKRVSKFLLRHFSKAARPWLESWGLLRTSMVYNRAALVLSPGAGRVLVLAPHMDDETIGCGGAIALHVRAGAQVEVIFMTDGRYGSRELPLGAEAKRRKELELIATRKQEAQRALAELGVNDMAFFDVEDGKLAESDWAAAKLRKRLDEFRPDTVYLPSFLELHPDHLATSRVLLDAVRDAAPAFQCHAYEVWTPLFPNCLVRIDDVLETKKRALAQYASQLADADYLHSALGLNAYRASGFLDRYGGYAEAFLSVDVARYRGLYDAYVRP